MRVWIEQDLCTGDGLCNDYCFDVFRLQEDGISYVRDASTGETMSDPGGHTCAVDVPAHFEHAVIDAALFCPGECIYIEEHADYDRPTPPSSPHE